ncbi:hypothetical protein [Clostridium sp.]|uniref:hypothetical protein n=1 Tax=Clostridium sp. TaxID=1506 RepID=UPI003217A544
MINSKTVFELISKDKLNLIKIAKSVKVDFEGVLGFYIVFDRLPIKEALLKISDDIVEEFKDKEELWNEIIKDL